VIITTAKWEGSSLILVTAMTYPAGNKAEIRQVWSLDAQKQLVSEVSRRRDSDAAPPKPITMVYRRQQP
jgi:hypothetical protein